MALPIIRIKHARILTYSALTYTRHRTLMDSKTVLHQYSSVLNWRCRIRQVDYIVSWP